MDINTRLKQIEDLDAYLAEKNDLLSDVLSNVGWSKDTLNDEIKVQCPVDSGHWVHGSALSQHVDMCSWLKDGYLKEEKEKQPPSSKGFYQHATSVISLTVDKDTQANILVEKGLMQKNYLDEVPDLPKTVDRWTLEMTPEQRLAVYDYVVQVAKSSNKPKNMTLEDLMFDFEKKSDQDGRPKTDMEILAEQRDYKRRRQSYRAKNVHITKKSYTEVMKEVIENQITYLAETRKQDDNDRLEETPNDEIPIEKKEKRKREESSDREEERDSSHYRSTTRDRESNEDREDSEYDSGHRHRSRKDRSGNSSLKKRKHKHHRSRSRSRSKHHKKSHKHKHKKSRDS